MRSVGTITDLNTGCTYYRLEVICGIAALILDLDGSQACSSSTR